MIGTAEVISTVSRRAIAGVPPLDVHGREHRRLRGREHHARAPDRAARRASSASARRRRAGPRVRRPLVAEPPPGLRFQRKDTEQYHVCLGAPGISRSDRRRFAASLLDSILGGSASSRLFQEIREKRGMAYSVYSFASQYTDTGLDRRLRRDARGEPAACIEICAEQIADIAAGNLRARRARAREGEPQGPDHALDGVDVEPHEPARQVAHLRHRAADVRADLRRDRRRRRGGASRSSPPCCSPPERLSASGVGPDEDRFRSAVERANPSLVARAAA